MRQVLKLVQVNLFIHFSLSIESILVPFEEWRANCANSGASCPTRFDPSSRTAAATTPAQAANRQNQEKAPSKGKAYMINDDGL